jgi:hypothetical protein
MFTSMPVRLERAGHCQRCEHYRRSTKQCNMCGCLVNLKVTIARSVCPVGKWGAAKEGNDFAAEVSNAIKSFLNLKK